MKSVLFISRTCSRDLGGMQTHTSVLLSALSGRSDLDLQVCCFDGSISRLPFFFLRAIISALKTRQSTVLVADGVLSPIFFLLAIFRPRVRLVAIVHGLDVAWRFPLYRTVVGVALRKADRIAPVSQYTASLLRSLGVHSDRIMVIPCPAPPVSGTPHRRHTHQILLLGRLVKRKGTVWFLRFVLPILHAQDSAFTVVIAGDGPERTRIHSFIVASPLSDHIQMMGIVSEQEKDALLRESVMLVVPNLHDARDPEGFGIICLESASRGLPVVAARTDGLLDSVVDGVTGTFFSSGSAEDCARAIVAARTRSWDRAAMHSAIESRFAPPLIASQFVHDII